MQRNSILNERHRQLGSKLDGDTWNNMPIPWSYHSDAHEEVIATRTRAGLYDVSALNIVNVSGPDAESVIDHLVSIDVTRLQPGSARLAAEVDACNGCGGCRSIDATTRMCPRYREDAG